MYSHALLLDCTALEDVAAVASAHALGQMPPDVIRGRVGMPVDRVQDFTFVQTVFEICITAPSSSLDRFISPIMRFVMLLAPQVHRSRRAPCQRGA